MALSRPSVLAGGGVMVSVATGWLFLRPRANEVEPASGRVRIVAAPDPRPLPLSAPAAGTPRRPDAGETALSQLTVNERAGSFGARPRDESWASRTERDLRIRMSETGNGLSVDAVRCADTLCRVDYRIPFRSEADRQETIDRLLAGSLHPIFARAGLRPLDAITIDVDPDKNLVIVEYLARV